MQKVTSALLALLVATLTATAAEAQAAGVPEGLPAAAASSDGMAPAAEPAGLTAGGARGTDRVLVAPQLQAGADALLRLELASVPSLSSSLETELLRQDRRRGLTWVVVGGALIAAGLVIDGDAGAAVSVGGAVLGAYGVYLLVRR
jgi:hypothetical protein